MKKTSDNNVTLDRWQNVLPDDRRAVAITSRQYYALANGETITIRGKQYTMDSGPFRLV